MDGDHDELGTVHEENVDLGPQTPNDLDLNVEQNCCSPDIVHVYGSQSGLSSTNVLSNSTVLGIGTEFESDDHAYRFYNKYARLVGFNVRKDWINRSKVHGQVVSRKFTCSKEGYRRKDKRDTNVKKHRKETRTGCLAHMIITRQPDGKYQVTHFESQHNHDNINPSNANMLNLQNEFSIAQAVHADSSNNLGPKSKSALDMMNKKLGARETLDQLSMNYDNYLHSERERDMSEGEAGRLLGYFQRQHFENPTFFYAIQLDVDDKVSNLFWADDNMVVDYDHFGDVICLDTTCRTNRDLRPFVQFLGVNNHKQVLIFAAAFLYDNTIESFNWLFRTFTNAMSGKKPKAILTEQEVVIIEAVNTVLPETNHCTCVWQMYENTLKHLSHVVKDAESFANDLRSSIYDPKDEEEFTHAWEAMLEKYNLQQNEWLRWMYREKEKWAVVFGRNTFFVDIKGFHLGELLSHKFRSYLNSDLDIVQFFKHFERVVDEQRYKEIEASDEMSGCLPRLMGNVVLLKHASDVYTPRAFEVFQRGYEKSLNVLVNQNSRNGSLSQYKANTFGHTRQYSVTFNSSDDTVVCSCMKFEHVGFLCSHALKVLDNKNIKVAPSQYILKRWTKDARLGNLKEIRQYKMQDNPKMVVASCYKDLCLRLLKLSARASESVEAYQFATRQLDEVMEGVEKILTLKVEEAQVITSSSIDANASESEPAEIFLNRHAIEDQLESNRVNGEDRRATQDRDHQTTVNCNGTDSDRILSVEVSSPNTVVCIPSPSSVYVSSQSAAPNPILQGLYSFEANQAVHCIYEQPNLVLDHQSNTNIFQPPNFFSNQHDSPGQSQLLPEPIIQSTYHESMASNNQMRQGMDLDIQNPHSSSFLLYDHRYRSSDSA
ncbi:protein FAR1-RELATED SEQUENCE 5-like [Gastrolobium bilobum]|uniref:protein FAR1-RELATED SEQUENCE 5-like n=1 Tax=Gastrolobium bilobum TaxID=150636 RepID=UPI002AB07416|nr:protein FAR1-RELATED SEQUENCE 5-like [Gastrolobium bilobum]XP_061359923.1 protein FAR1-RELATED SEQUENCE 5-like [Gastrolobium bilobum]XP_061359928.1 protein FAR1-RELATED SEQUENCE 5-like [Gastrolobium bilobum]